MSSSPSRSETLAASNAVAAAREGSGPRPARCAARTTARHHGEPARLQESCQGWVGHGHHASSRDRQGAGTFEGVRSCRSRSLDVVGRVRASYFFLAASASLRRASSWPTCSRRPRPSASRRPPARPSRRPRRPTSGSRRSASGASRRRDLGRLADAVAQVVQLRPADRPGLLHLDLGDPRRVDREDALDALALHEPADGDGLAGRRRSGGRSRRPRRSGRAPSRRRGSSGEPRRVSPTRKSGTSVFRLPRSTICMKGEIMAHRSLRYVSAGGSTPPLALF